MEEDEMDSLPRQGSLPSDKELEETQNVKVTFIRVLPIRPPSPEDSRLPAPSAPPTGSEDHQEAASTSQGISGVECTTNSCTPFLARRTDVSIALIKEMLQLMSDRVPNLLVASPDIPGGQICSSQSAMKLLAQDMVAKISTILQSDPDVLQAVQSKAGLESVIMTIKNALAGTTTVHQEEQRLAGVEPSREDLIQPAACRPLTPEFELEADEIRQGISGIMDESLIARRPEIADSIIYRSLCMGSHLPQSGMRATDKVKMTIIFLEPQPQTSPTAQPSQADEERVGTEKPCQSVPATTSGPNLEHSKDQEAKQEHSRPLLMRMFRALKKSIHKTFCCLGDSGMVQQ